jgi:hypothetical protein
VRLFAKLEEMNVDNSPVLNPAVCSQLYCQQQRKFETTNKNHRTSENAWMLKQRTMQLRNNTSFKTELPSIGGRQRQDKRESVCYRERERERETTTKLANLALPSGTKCLCAAMQHAANIVLRFC